MKAAWLMGALFFDIFELFQELLVNYELYRTNKNCYEFCLAFSYDSCSDANKKRINEFFEKMGKQCKLNRWGYMHYYLEQKEYAIETVMKGDFSKLIKTIHAEKKK